MVDDLLIVRHAIAEERRPGVADGARHLTEEGVERMKLAARGVHRLLPKLDQIYTSPLLRAGQTADIVSREYGALPVVTLKSLAPPQDTGRLIETINGIDARCVALVGHEPGLSQLVAALICRDHGGGIVLKKGGMALLHFAGPVGGGEGTLQWLLRPKQLRVIGSRA